MQQPFVGNVIAQTKATCLDSWAKCCSSQEDQHTHICCIDGQIAVCDLFQDEREFACPCQQASGNWGGGWVCVSSWSQECPSRVAYLWFEVGGGEVGAHGHPPRPDVVVLPKQLQPSPP